MLKNIFYKIRHNKALMMLVCVAPVIIVVGIFSLSGGNNSWAWLFILLCPLAHLFMMKGHEHSHNEHDIQNDHDKKIGVEYKKDS